MSLPWSTIVVPETKGLRDIISEELKENLRRKNAECVPTSSAVKWKYDMTDEELAKILQEEYCICCTDDVCDSKDCENCDILCNSDSGLEDEEDPSYEMHYEKFNSILERFDPIPLYNCKHPHDVIKSRECKHVIVGIDTKAKLVLNDMIGNKVFDSVNTQIIKRKEVDVLLVKKYSESSYFPAVKRYIVKVFKAIPVSKQLQHDCVKGSNVCSSKIVQKPVYMKPAYEKAQREALHLQKLKKVGIPCPEVITLKRHVIVLSLIGERKLANTLKDVHLDDIRHLIAYEQIMEYMKKMYRECNLIHTNLSEENILWHNNCCYVISLSKAVDPHEEGSLKLLFDDCTRICKFFTKVGVPKVVSPDELFMDIVGCSYLNRVGLNEFQENKKKERF
ncbi:hypothetical protein Trydic_g13616 [Trypoxylus dichotomus]